MLNSFHVNIGVVYAVWHILGSIFTEKYVRNLNKNLTKLG